MQRNNYLQNKSLTSSFWPSKSHHRATKAVSSASSSSNPRLRPVHLQTESRFFLKHLEQVTPHLLQNFSLSFLVAEV